MPREVYAPYRPLNVLKPIGQDIWIVDGPEIRFAAAGLRMPFPTRMTVVRLPDGNVWLHSPTEPDDALVESIRSLGPVRFLVAPNTLHYWWIPDRCVRCPEAEVYAAPGLERRAKRVLAIPHIMGHTAPAAWSNTIAQVLVEGGLLSEVDFFHRPSRTLILTDLIENFELGRVRSWFYRLLMRLGGARDPDGKAPIDMQLSFLRRRKAVRTAVRQMIAWEPERIVIAHGRWYDDKATDELRRAFRWVL